MIFNNGEHVAVKDDGEWVSATVIEGNRYGGVWFYVVELLNGSRRTVKYSEHPNRTEIDGVGDGCHSDDVNQYLPK